MIPLELTLHVQLKILPLLSRIGRMSIRVPKRGHDTELSVNDRKYAIVF